MPIMQVLGILPPGTFHPGIFSQEMFPPEKKPNVFFLFVTALFRFVAWFVRVRIEASSGNRFASTAYFTKPGFVGEECSRGNNRGGTFWAEFPGGQYSGHHYVGAEASRTVVQNMPNVAMNGTRLASV